MVYLVREDNTAFGSNYVMILDEDLFNEYREVSFGLLFVIQPCF